MILSKQQFRWHFWLAVCVLPVSTSAVSFKFQPFFRNCNLQNNWILFNHFYQVNLILRLQIKQVEISEVLYQTAVFQWALWNLEILLELTPSAVILLRPQLDFNKCSETVGNTSARAMLEHTWGVRDIVICLCYFFWGGERDFNFFF